MPATLEAVAILALLVIPGFLCWQLLSSRAPDAFVSDAHSVITALIFSILIHVLALPATISLSGKILAFSSALKNAPPGGQVPLDWAVFAWLIFILFITPMAMALIISSLWKARRLQGVLGKFGLSLVQQTPRAWDWFFLNQGKGCWVAAEMDDGNLVGGEYGQDSFSSLSPHREDLYLEKAYHADEDHKFLDPRQDSAGVWINGQKVKQLFFYRVNDGGSN